MIKVRFHGRGGQGMKTASRIVGTAAVLDGRLAQDSPIYGAERRGAPVAAFVRIADRGIFERGVIPRPHLVVVADDTLLDDPAAQVLGGLGPHGALLLATAHTAEEVRRHTRHPGAIVARDFLGLALERIGSRAGVSTALAAAAATLLGLSARAIDDALREELAAVGLSAERVEASLGLAAEARAGLGPLALGVVDGGPAGDRVVDITYAPPEIGAPTVVASANTPLRRTGNWRVFRPVIDLAKCTRCWVCFVRCPDGAIALDAADNPRVDYDVCKGCLICAEECPTGAITTEREIRQWDPTEVGA